MEADATNLLIAKVAINLHTLSEAACTAISPGHIHAVWILPPGHMRRTGRSRCVYVPPLSRQEKRTDTALAPCAAVYTIPPGDARDICRSESIRHTGRTSGHVHFVIVYPIFSSSLPETGGIGLSHSCIPRWRDTFPGYFLPLSGGNDFMCSR